MSTIVTRAGKGSPLTVAEGDSNFTNLNTDKQEVSGKDATGGYAGLTLFKINFKNAANTFTNFLTNATTAARTWTFPDSDGTVGLLGLAQTWTAAQTFVAPLLGTPASGDLRNCSLAVAPAIGSTTPAAGAFTTLSATGAISNTNTTAGQFNLGTAGFADGIANIFANVNTNNFVAMKTSADGTGGTYLTFENAAGSIIGTIKQATSSTTAYNTSSDARLKRDIGVATDTSVLKNTVIHDFEWLTNGSIDRGVFAQEAYTAKPSAVSPGSDEVTEDVIDADTGAVIVAGGALKNPWSVDYSKYVSDLIVGWQVHEATIAKLEARIAALGG